jgi:hypothetical protein
MTSVCKIERVPFHYCISDSDYLGLIRLLDAMTRLVLAVVVVAHAKQGNSGTVHSIIISITIICKDCWVLCVVGTYFLIFV